MKCDVAIIGGGMVGASLAVALAPLRLSVVLIEAVPFESGLQPSFDERTTALSNGSRRILTTLNTWAEAKAAAESCDAVDAAKATAVFAAEPIGARDGYTATSLKA